MLQNGGNDNINKSNKNIERLYNCYVLSQNLSGGVNNELSLQIKKRLDKKIAELNKFEGGVFGFGVGETAIVGLLLFLAKTGITEKVIEVVYSKVEKYIVNNVKLGYDAIIVQLKQSLKDAKIEEFIIEIVKKEVDKKYNEIVKNLGESIGDICSCANKVCNVISDEVTKAFKNETSDNLITFIKNIINTVFKDDTTIHQIAIELALDSENRSNSKEIIKKNLNSMINLKNNKIENFIKEKIEKEVDKDFQNLKQKLNPVYKSVCSCCNKAVSDIQGIFKLPF